MALALRAVALAGAVELAFTLLVAVAVAVVIQGIKTSDFLQGIKKSDVLQVLRTTAYKA